MPEGATYTRKLSRGEVSDGSILIEKTKWRFFPPPGEPLTLEAGGESFSVAIEAEDCSCVPPPHQHYHLPAAAFRSRIAFRPRRHTPLREASRGALSSGVNNGAMPGLFRRS